MQIHLKVATTRKNDADESLCRVDVATFSPSQVAEITGLTPTQQRDWRRRGILPPSQNGHARFDLLLTASILFMKHLAAFDIGPGFSRKMSGNISSEIVFQALLNGGLELNSDLNRSSSEWDTAELKIIQAICETDGEVPSSYAVVFPDGTFALANELDQILLLSERPAIVIPLAGLGEIMRARAGRPLASAEF
jgi:hypothetical protein